MRLILRSKLSMLLRTWSRRRPPHAARTTPDLLMTNTLIVSTAHEVVQALPLALNEFVCMKCGVRGSLSRLFPGAKDYELRCTPTYYNEGSGWQHDERYDKIEVEY